MTAVVCFPDDVQTSAVVISGSQVLNNPGDLRRYSRVQQIAPL
jgi:hypothetical protein